MSGAAKKLISVSATSTSMIGAGKEAPKRISCIYYPVQFKDTDKIPVQALIDSGSEVNTIHPSFAKKLSLPIRLTDVRAQKIDITTLDTHGIVVAAFSIVENANQVRFFEETFCKREVACTTTWSCASWVTCDSRDADRDWIECLK